MIPIFICLDVHKAIVAVATAEGTRGGEVRYQGEIPNDPASIAALLKKLSRKNRPLHFCYEAGGRGYFIYRQIVAAGHDCIVVAPSRIPRAPGDRVKTDRRDAQNLAVLHRAGDLTAVWVLDVAHEPMRNLVRTRLDAAKQLMAAPAAAFLPATPWKDL